MLPFMSVAAMPCAACSIIMLNRRDSRRSLRPSVTSSNDTTTPSGAPSAPAIGEAVMEIGRSTPSFETSAVKLENVHGLASRSAFSTTSSAGWRVSSEIALKTAGNGRPSASRLENPVNCSATPFISVTRPARSVQSRPSARLSSTMTRRF